MRIGLVRKQDIEQLGLWDKNSQTLLAFLLTFRSIRIQMYTICRMRTSITCAHFTPFHVYRQCLIVLPTTIKYPIALTIHFTTYFFLQSCLSYVPQVKCIYKIISLHRYFILCQALQYIFYISNQMPSTWYEYFIFTTDAISWFQIICVSKSKIYYDNNS